MFKRVLMQTPNRERQEYSRNIIGIYLPGIYYQGPYILLGFPQCFGGFGRGAVRVSGAGANRSWCCIPRWTPHAVIVTVRDNRDYIRVPLYSSDTSITGWGIFLMHAQNHSWVNAREFQLSCHNWYT